MLIVSYARLLQLLPQIELINRHSVSNSRFNGEELNPNYFIRVPNFFKTDDKKPEYLHHFS